MSTTARKLEGENPFDGYLSPETRQKVEEIQKGLEFEALEKEIRERCAAAAEAAQANREHWARAHEKEHEVRLERAEETVSNEVRDQVLIEEAEQARQDDCKYGWITCYDELLQLTSDEEYLRARASLERRMKQARETGIPLRQPWTLGRICLLLSYLIVVYISIYVMFDVGVISGLVAGGFLTLIWAFLVRIPGIFGDLADGGSTRGSGNAV